MDNHCANLLKTILECMIKVGMRRYAHWIALHLFTLIGVNYIVI